MDNNIYNPFGLTSNPKTYAWQFLIYILFIVAIMDMDKDNAPNCSISEIIVHWDKEKIKKMSLWMN